MTKLTSLVLAATLALGAGCKKDPPKPTPEEVAAQEMAKVMQQVGAAGSAAGSAQGAAAMAQAMAAMGAAMGAAGAGMGSAGAEAGAEAAAAAAMAAAPATWRRRWPRRCRAPGACSPGSAAPCRRRTRRWSRRCRRRSVEIGAVLAASASADCKTIATALAPVAAANKDTFAKAQALKDMKDPSQAMALAGRIARPAMKMAASAMTVRHEVRQRPGLPGHDVEDRRRRRRTIPTGRRRPRPACSACRFRPTTPAW
ncbi:MAG: hypothetical protein R2939_10105 [Kofleriaceae bacterium]